MPARIQIRTSPRRFRFPRDLLLAWTALTLAAVPSGAPSTAEAPWPAGRWQIVPPKQPLELAFPGSSGAIPYERFGRFEGVGTAQYRFLIMDRAGLARAVGEGIYPNTDALRDPACIALRASGRLEGSHWRFVDGADSTVNFYKWATAAEDAGVKQYYTAVMFERLGMLAQAVQAYYAVAVHFPRTVSYTYFRTPWCVGPSSLDRMEQILRRHPELRLRWTGGSIQAARKFASRGSPGPFVSDPGRLVEDPRGHTPPRENLQLQPVADSVGGPRIQLKKYANHHWQLLVDDHPFLIRAITYSVTPVGLTPHDGTWDVSRDWQRLDMNKNGLHDGFFESYVDGNGNGRQDRDEPTIGDARLLKDLGINTIRAYHHLYDKELFRQLHRQYGFYVLCGDLLGGYAVGSGARWAVGTDYTNPAQQSRMLASVRRMVEAYKGEPYVLMWVLGNENVYGTNNNAHEKPEAFFDLVERAARLIKEIDPSRPVAIANGDILHLDLLKARAPHVDVVGLNAYRGEQGFGRHLFSDVRQLLDKPVLISEYGAPAFAEGFSASVAEAFQGLYLDQNWEDIAAHQAGRGVGNAIGGVLFEWLDEWWKTHGFVSDRILNGFAARYPDTWRTVTELQPYKHDVVPQFGGPFLDSWSYEEWFGIASQGAGEGSPFARTLRPAYHRLKESWNDQTGK